MKSIFFLAANSYAATLNPTLSASLNSSSITTSPAPSTPIVKLDYATFSGKSMDGINTFLGIPFAQQPIGNLRLRVALPPISLGSEIIPVITYGPACPQQKSTQPSKFSLTSNPLFAPLAGILSSLNFGTNFTSEACLSLNVIAPVVEKGEKLPVLVWIYGGGFAEGYSGQYDGTPIVKRSIKNGQKVIFVSMNYRLAGFGFLGGNEVKAEGVGNLGLQDQREALRWVQKNIEKYGGDREKITIFGESAGAISASLQIITPFQKKEKLFRSAILMTGSPTQQGDIASEKAQLSYDRVIQFTGCDKAKNSLQCLREVSFERFNDAINAQSGLRDYGSRIGVVFKPRVDGVFLTEDPFKSVKQGNFDHVPIISGDCDDEGTIFSLTMLNETTEAGFRNFVKQQFAPTISEVDLNELALAYPSNATLGSPFDTGLNNSLTPQFKRFASFQGDFVFQSPRRLFLKHAKSPVYSYIYKVGKKTPFFGAFHSSDIQNEFFAPGTGSVDGQYQFIDYAINFVHHLTPNREIFSRSKQLIHWPRYHAETEKLLTWSDKNNLIGETGNKLSISHDTYRKAEMKVLLKLAAKYDKFD